MNKADVIALKRVFGVTDVDRLSKGRLVTANTSHMHFIDYMMVELYKHDAGHEVFKEFTEEQHALMRKHIAEEKKREYMMGKQHAPECTVEVCAEKCEEMRRNAKKCEEMRRNAKKCEEMRSCTSR